MLPDRKMILVLLIILSHRGADAADKTILKSEPVTNWGKWNEWSRCPDGEYVYGMQIRYESPEGGGGDLTGLNNVKLFCHPIGNENKENSIMSGKGFYGDWTEKKMCPPGTIAIGFALRSQQNQHNKDDVAADNFRLYCGNVSGSRNSDQDVVFESGKMGQLGDWTEDHLCPERSVVCGIQTQIVPDTKQAKEDHTGLNNVNIECCLTCPKYQFETIHHYNNNEAGTVPVKYTKRVSFTDAETKTKPIDDEKKKLIFEKVNASTGISYEIPVREIGGSSFTGVETFNGKELMTMVQDAMKNRKEETAETVIPAFTYGRVDQLVVICEDVRIGLAKFVSKYDPDITDSSNYVTDVYITMIIIAFSALLVTFY